MEKEGMGQKFEELVRIIGTLRSEQGCPWDRKQDERSIADYFLEEVYEALEAVLAGDSSFLAEELGDVLMEVVFLARIYEEKGEFAISDALEKINAKMIERHPHVFGSKKITSAEDVVDEWQKLKLMEKGRNSVFEGMTASLPALLAAFQIGQKVSAFGFDWSQAQEALQKVKEEIGELENALESGGDEDKLQEIGDLFFSLANVSRLLSINPELALRRANQKFMTRFSLLERELKERGKELGRVSFEEMDRIWEKIKRDDGPKIADRK